MLVKKFEAKSVKEALNMVKSQLGPDAIILAVKESHKGFGLAGGNSFEVTAAASEIQVRQKAQIESKMPANIKEKFANSSARVQKQIIERAFDRNPASVPASKEPKRATNMRYIDIADDEQSQVVKQSLPQPKPPEPLKRIDPNQKDAEIATLKNELSELKKLISHFQKIPQSFVGNYRGAEYGLPFELSFAFEKLVQVGLSEHNAAELVREVKENMVQENWKRKPLVVSWIAKNIMKKLDCCTHPYAKKVHCFVGGVGQGKTTTLIKMASHLSIEDHKKVLIATVDTLKVGASEQLRLYAQMLNVPFAIIRTAQDWIKLADHLEDVDYVLVDFPGLSMRQVEHGQYIANMLPPAYFKADIHYVQSAVAKDEDAFAVHRKFELIGPSNLIFTNLDETNRHGIIYNMQQEFKLPLHSFSIGPRVPEDFEVATRERVIDLFFDLSNWRNKNTLNEKGA